jgi:hypothetical protein
MVLPIADFKCLRPAFASSFNKLRHLVMIFLCFHFGKRGKKISNFGKPIFYVTHSKNSTAFGDLFCA